MAGAPVVIFQNEWARRQYVRRRVLADGFVDASHLLTVHTLRMACAEAAIRQGILQGRMADVAALWPVAAEVAQAALHEFAGRGPLGSMSVGALSDLVIRLANVLAPLGPEVSHALDRLLAERPGTKMHQLGRLYALYRDRLQQCGLVDDADIHAAVVKVLKGRRDHWPEVLQQGEVEIHFRILPVRDPTTDLLLATLQQECGSDVVRVVPLLPLAHTESIEDRLSARLRTEVFAGLEIEGWPSWAEDLGDALAVEDAQLAADSREHILLLQGPTLSGEVEDVLRALCDAMEELELAPDQVALVTPPDRKYLEAVLEAARRYDLPICHRFGAALIEHPVTRVLLALMEFVLEPTREHFCSVMESPLLRLEDLGSWSDRRTAAAEAVRSGLPPQWSVSGAELCEYGLPAQVQNLILNLHKRLTCADEDNSLRARATWALKLLSEFDSATLDPIAAGVLERLGDLLAKWTRSPSGSYRCSVAEFIALFEQALSYLSVRPEWLREHGIWLLTTDEVGGLHFEVVALLGLNEGVFPTYGPADLLFSDDERRRLAEVLAPTSPARGAWSTPAATLRAIRQRAQFLACLFAARQRLILSCSAHDEDGRSLNPSDLFQAVSNLVRSPSPICGPSWKATRPLSCARTEEESRRRLGLLASGNAEPTPEEQTVLNAQGFSEADSDLVRRIQIEWQRERFFSAPNSERCGYCGQLPASPWGDEVTRWIGLRRPFAAESLNALAACRYRFLLQEICGLVAPEYREAIPDPQTRGRLLHEILRQVYRFLRGDSDEPRALAERARDEFRSLRGPGAWAVEVEPGRWRLSSKRPSRSARALPLVALTPEQERFYVRLVHAVAEALFAIYENQRVLIGDSVYWAVEWPKIKTVVANILQADARLCAAERRYPALFEFAFGMADPDALVLIAQPQAIRVCGRADRADLVFDESGELREVVIFDYKSSTYVARRKEVAEEIAAGLMSSLPLYAFGVQRLLFANHNVAKLNDLTSVSLVPALRDIAELEKYLKGERVSLGGQTMLAEAFVAQMAQNFERIVQADFAVRPQDCTFCAYAPVCRVDATALMGEEL